MSYKLSTNDTVIDCRTSVSIPPIPHSATLQLVQLAPELSYILVVEKHTVFTSLVSARYTAIHHCLLLTGCGFADTATRDFLVQLTQQLPLLPVYALVDCDVYGLSIYQSYKYGGKTRGGSGERLVVAKMQLLGVHVWECKEMKEEMDERCDGQWEAAMKLTDGDRRRVESMLRAQPVEHDEQLRGELVEMAEFGYKSEVEALNAFGGANYLAQQYLPHKVATMQEEAEEQPRFAAAAWEEHEEEQRWE